LTGVSLTFSVWTFDLNISLYIFILQFSEKMVWRNAAIVVLVLYVGYAVAEENLGSRNENKVNINIRYFGF